VNELKEILLGIGVLIYGLMFYVIGRTNFLEAVIVRRLQEFIDESKIVTCQECRYRSEDGFCHIDIEGVGYKKTHEDGFCDRGEI
jgi:hypothetical protein